MRHYLVLGVVGLFFITCFRWWFVIVLDQHCLAIVLNSIFLCCIGSARNAKLAAWLISRLLSQRLLRMLVPSVIRLSYVSSSCMRTRLRGFISLLESHLDGS